MDNMTTTNYKGFKIVSEKVGKFGTSTRYRSGKLIAPRKKDVISEIDRLLDRKKIIDYEIQRLDRFTAEQGDEGLDLCPKCNSLGEWSDERDGGGNPLYKCVECGTYF